MCGDCRKPWWFSGDEPEPEPEEEFDGQDAAAEPEPGASPGGAVDWGLLLAGASRMVDWATSAVMAPHAEHEDPAAHPQCVVCRTLVLVQDPAGFGSARPAGGKLAEDVDLEVPSSPTAEPIVWIPVVEDPAQPGD
jgi:hypothetical protein